MSTGPVKKTSTPRRSPSKPVKKPVSTSKPTTAGSKPSATPRSAPASATPASKSPETPRDTTSVGRAEEKSVRPATETMTDSIKEDLEAEQAAAREAERRGPQDRRQESDRRVGDVGSPTGVDRRSSDRRIHADRRSVEDRRGADGTKPGQEFDLEKNSLDLSKPQSVGGIKRAIDFMANENGESTKLGFHLEGAARNGAAKIGGWGDLGLKVSQSDTGSTVMGFNYEAAVKAGLDLKFLEIGGAVGVKGAVQARFKNSGDAAAWLGEGLQKFSDKAGGLFDIQQQKFVYDKPTTVKAVGTFGKAMANAKFGPFQLSAEAGMETVDKTFIKPDGSQQKGRETALTAGANRKLKLGDFEYDVSYNYRRSTISGDVNEHNNGTYDNHQVGLQLSMSKLKSMSPKQIRSTIAGLAMINGGEGLSAKAIESMANNIDTIMKNPPSRGFKGSLGLRFEANNVLENGKMENQYKRMFLDIGASYGGKANLGVVEAEARTSLNKSELITEKIGSQTETYVKQNLSSLQRKGQWDQFKEKNKDALFSMARSHMKSNPSPELATALKKGDQDGAIAAMTSSWKNEEKVNQQISQDAKKLANFGNQFHFSNSEEAQMLKVLRGYEGRWGEMSKLLKKMEAQGITKETLMNKTGGFFSTHDEELKGYYDIARQWESIHAS
jgi:hypothetical protein